MSRSGEAAYLPRADLGSGDMGAAVAARSAALRARARAVRAQAGTLRREAVARRRRTEELCDELAGALVATGCSFGSRGDRFLLRVGRLRPMVRLARHDLRRWLEAADVPLEVVDEVVLACSEACANAVEHPERATKQLVEIEAQRDAARLTLRVRDYGAWSEQRVSAWRGRGIGMIDRLMDSVDVQRHARGTEIVMHRSLRSRAGVAQA